MGKFLTFRLFILLFIFIIFLQVVVLNIYFNFISFGSDISNKNAAPLKTQQRKHVKFKDKTLHQKHCNITDKQAISALNRMVTLECKKECVDVFCTIKQQTPWMNYIKSRCEDADYAKGAKLYGCFYFSADLLSLFSNKKHNLFFKLSTEECSQSCFQFNYKYFGRFSGDCICSDDIIAILNRNNLTFVSCDMCLGDKCPNQLKVFLTGLKKPSRFVADLSSKTQTFNIAKPTIVFLLLVNGRSFFQINRLLKNIYSENHFYYIHVDLRHNYMYNELLILEDKFSNIKLARNRYASIWGGSSFLSTILSCIKDVFENWKKWDFIINLSETDFPIKPLNDFEKYLSLNYGRNFVKSHGKNTFDFVQMQALNKVFIECEQHMWRISDRELIKGIVWDGGSDWVVLSQNFSYYLTYGDDHLLNGLKNYYKYSLLPAESFFHVILRNTEYCSTIVSSNLRATNWNRKKGCKCQHRNVVDWCGCSPNAFRSKDSARLRSINLKPLFFARKFEHIVDREIIDYVEQHFLRNELFLLDDNFYLESVYNVKYDEPISDVRLGFYMHFVQSANRLISNNCQFTNNLVLPTLKQFTDTFVQSSISFRNNDFYGNLLSFRKTDSTNFSINFELLVRKIQNDTILIDLPTKPKLKRVKICNRFDVKEEIFRDFECLIDQNTRFEVLHEWELFFGVYTVIFAFLDSRNQIHSIHQVKLNNTDSGVDYVMLLFTPTFNHYPLESGMWKLIILNQLDIICAYKFYVIGSSQTRIDKKLENLESDNVYNQKIRYGDVINQFVVTHFLFFNTVLSYQSNWHIDELCYDFEGTLHFNVELSCHSDKVLPCNEANWSFIKMRSQYLIWN